MAFAHSRLLLYPKMYLLSYKEKETEPYNFIYQVFTQEMHLFQLPNQILGKSFTGMMQGKNLHFQVFFCSTRLWYHWREEESKQWQPGWREDSSQGSARSLPNHGKAPAGHCAGFSPALTTPIAHIGGERMEWSNLNPLPFWQLKCWCTEQN